MTKICVVTKPELKNSTIWETPDFHTELADTRITKVYGFECQTWQISVYDQDLCRDEDRIEKFDLWPEIW
jgi:hypothetical protein